MPVEVSISSLPSTVAEGDFLDSITFLTSEPIPSDEFVIVNFSIIPDTATPEEDYGLPPELAVFDPITGRYNGRLFIPGGASIGSVSVEAFQDDLVEQDEFFEIVITDVNDSATIGSDSSIAITISDDDGVVENQVTVTTATNASELGTNGQFIVSLTDAATTETVIAYTVEGTAMAGADYVALTTNTVTIPAGSLSATIDIAALDDPYFEGDETVTLSLDAITAGDDNVILGDTTTATVNITDDTTPTVLYRVNAGGPEIAAIDGGPNWSADGGFLFDPGSDRTARFSAVEAGDTVPLSTPGEIFDTERFDLMSAVDDTTMQYAFDVDPGVYEVRLYMGNGFEGTSLAGERVFDVAIEGQVLPNLDNIDLVANFGHLVGGMLSNQITVTDGSLNLEFLHDMVSGVQNPLINGIEVIQIGDTAPVPTVSVAGESIGSSENGRFSQTTLVTSEPVPSEGDVTITVEVIPGTATPLEDYVYDSLTATFNPQTGIYTDEFTISSGFSVTNVVVTLLEESIQEGSGAFTVNISDVSGANFEIGTSQLASTVFFEEGIQPLSLIIEAEDVSYTGFQPDTLSAASGGQALRFGGGEAGEVGMLTLEIDAITGFTPGEYDISVKSFDMLFPGGQASTTFSVTLNDDVVSVGDIALRTTPISNLDENGVNERILATGVQLSAGDTLTITGFENPDEAFWLDSIQFTPVVSEIA